MLYLVSESYPSSVSFFVSLWLTLICLAMNILLLFFYDFGCVFHRQPSLEIQKNSQDIEDHRIHTVEIISIIMCQNAVLTCFRPAFAQTTDTTIWPTGLRKLHDTAQKISIPEHGRQTHVHTDAK